MTKSKTKGFCHAFGKNPNDFGAPLTPLQATPSDQTAACPVVKAEEMIKLFKKVKVAGGGSATFRLKQQFFKFVQRNKNERLPLFTEHLTQRCLLARPFPCTAPAHLLTVQKQKSVVLSSSY